MRIVLGVAGGIAAYKAIDVCRQLVDAGAHVAPVLTADATRFVGTVTFSCGTPSSRGFRCTQPLMRPEPARRRSPKSVPSTLRVTMVPVRAVISPMRSRS